MSDVVRLKYLGPDDEHVFVHPTRGGFVVKIGDIIEVTEREADQLLKMNPFPGQSVPDEVMREWKGRVYVRVDDDASPGGEF